MRNRGQAGSDADVNFAGIAQRTVVLRDLHRRHRHLPSFPLCCPPVRATALNPPHLHLQSSTLECNGLAIQKRDITHLLRSTHQESGSNQYVLLGFLR